jgi:hypothetical protein
MYMSGNLIDKKLIELLASQEAYVYDVVKASLPKGTSDVETAFVYLKVTDRIANEVGIDNY